MVKKKMDCIKFKCKSGYDYLCCDFCFRIKCEDKCLNNHSNCKLAVERNNGQRKSKKGAASVNTMVRE